MNRSAIGRILICGGVMLAGATLDGATLGGLFHSSPVHAQPSASQESLALTATILNEGYEPAVDVSGTTLKGVMVEPSGHPDGQAEHQHLYLWLPRQLETRDKRLCLSLNSRDGQYVSQLEVLLESGPALSSPLEADTVLRADFTTTKPEYYTRYADTPPPHRLAVLAELKADCNPATPRDAVVVAGWQPYAAPPETLSVLVNAGRLEALLAVWLENNLGNQQQQGLRCAPIEAASRIAYDTACELRLSSLGKYGRLLLDDPSRLPSIILRRGGSVAAAVPLDIQL
ncbi:hypothetical protein IOC61_04185 [Halomonas sp. KAO]|uniref:hypothetical protein n=1 Tax=Halomonas sp. KAO TaxID=2783858 RepID=UPI00189EA498|nr:hypothetical protein [Halomonas sp. KAO]MBF7052514.1 hypothetical protein [Halomonas sp. KAO]